VELGYGPPGVVVGGAGLAGLTPMFSMPRRPGQGRGEAGHPGALPGLPCLPPGSGLGPQSQRLEQRAARGALLDRFEKLIQAPASLTEQVAGLVEEG
jgi:hypothetical protein